MSDLKVTFSYAGWTETCEPYPFVSAEFDGVVQAEAVRSLVDAFDACATEQGLRAQARTFVSGVNSENNSFVYISFDGLPGGVDPLEKMSVLASSIRQSIPKLNYEAIA